MKRHHVNCLEVSPLLIVYNTKKNHTFYIMFSTTKMILCTEEKMFLKLYGTLRQAQTASAALRHISKPGGIMLHDFKNIIFK